MIRIVRWLVCQNQILHFCMIKQEAARVEKRRCVCVCVSCLVTLLDSNRVPSSTLGLLLLDLLNEWGEVALVL